MKTFFLKNGNVVIEALFAVGILALCMIAVIAAVISATRTIRLSNNNALANKYAQEGIEVVRGVRDNMIWSDFRSDFTNSMGLGIGQTNPSGSCPSIANIDNYFTRCINFDHSRGNDRTIITSFVTWDESGIRHKVELETQLTKWSFK